MRAVKYLEEGQRLDQLINYLKVQKKEFAAMVGVSSSNVSDMVKGYLPINKSVIDFIYRNYPEISLDWVFSGTGDMIVRKNSVIIAGTANAGYIGIGVSQIFDTGKMIKYRSVGQEAKALYIQGDSMVPTLNDGSTVICERLLDIMDIRQSRVYVVVTSTGISAKRIRLDLMARSAMLIPDNPEYQAHKIALDDLLEVWEVKIVIYDSKLD